MMNRNRALIFRAAIAGWATGCASTAPAQLVEARSAYVTSNNGLAKTLTPTDLYEAKKELDLANTEFAEHGDTAICRDRAYIAARKFELADTKARTQLDRQNIAEAAKAGVAARDNQAKNTQAELASARQELKDERRDNNATTAQLETEKNARMSAEGKLAGAMRDLATIAAVKEEERGMVITLSGSVLFASGKYALLNTAMDKLDQVAEALKAQHPDQRMVVEGHTDNVGSEASNQRLSLNRANAVRDRLVTRGVASDRITAVGMGFTKPIADNKTAEGRANNRRVEIIIGNAGFSAR